MLLTGFAVNGYTHQFRSRYDAESLIRDCETNEFFEGRSAADVTEVPRVFRIPTERLAEFEAALVALQKRADRLDLGAVVAVRVGESETRGDADRGFRLITFNHYNVEVPSQRLALEGGWKLVAAIDHVEGDGGVAMNVVRSAPNAPALSKSFRTCGPTCDHCNTKRDRRSTFVLAAEDGTLARIGRNCLKDFLGVDPAGALNSLEFLASIEGLGDFEGFGGGGGGGYYAFSAKVVIAETISVVREHGWVSGKVARERDITPTSARVWANLTWTPSKYNPTPPPAPTDEDYAKAADVLAWVAAIDADTDNDYLYSLKANTARGAVGYQFRNVGVVVSAFAAYRRATEPPPERAARKPRAHLGTVGARYGGSKKGSPAALEGTIKRCSSYTGNFGPSTVVVVEVDLGETVAECVWFATGVIDHDAGTRVKVAGTVKEHSKDKRSGEPQTVLGRCDLTVL